MDFSQRMPPVQNIATFDLPRSSASLRSTHWGNSLKLRVSGSMAPWNVPIATS